MQTILFFNNNTELLKVISSVKLKHCNLIIQDNIRYIFHHIEEQLPGYVIIDYDDKNTDIILRFLSTYPDLKVILTASKQDDRLKNMITGEGLNNISLKNTGNPDDFIRILMAIDNLESLSTDSSYTHGKYLASLKKYNFLKQQIISFYSIQGGIGKSTVALNLAWALKNLQGIEILYIDLNFSQGPSDITLKLGLPQYGGLGQFIEKISDGNEAFYNSIYKIKGSNLSFLQSPSSLYLSDRFDIDLLNELVNLARREFNIIIADVPNRSDNVSLEMLNLSTGVLFLSAAESAQIMRINIFLNILQAGQKRGLIINKCNNDKAGKKFAQNLSDLSDIPVVKYIYYQDGARQKFLKINRRNTGIIDISEQVTDLADYVILS